MIRLLALGCLPVQMTEGSHAGTNDWGLLPTPVTAGGDRPCAPGSNNSNLPFCDDTKPLAERVADLIGRLTLEEKIGELTTGNGVNGGTTNNAIPRLSIPAWDWWSEGTHGVKGAYNAPPHTVFPFPITTAMAFNRTLWHATAQHIAREGRSEYNEGRFDGLTYWAPVVNLVRVRVVNLVRL